MTHLRLNEIGDLTLVVGNHVLKGKVKNIELVGEDDYDIGVDYEYLSSSMYSGTITYSINAEFVASPEGHAYTIKELPKMEPITYTAETVLGVENWNDKGVKAARKRVGAPKGSAYFIYSENQSPATIKFTWTQES